AGEVVVVDDGSTDATAALVSALAAGDPRVRLIRHGRRCGYGAALRTGFAAARFDWVVVWDADGQFDLCDLDRLAAHADTADVIVGRRARRSDPQGRVVLGALWSALVRGVLAVRVRDIDCGFKLLPVAARPSAAARERGGDQRRDPLPRRAVRRSHRRGRC